MVPFLLLYGIFLEPSLRRYLPFFAFYRQASGLWSSCSFFLESSVLDLLMAPVAHSGRPQFKCHLYKLDRHLKQPLITSTPSASISSWPVFFCFLVVVQCLHPHWSVNSREQGPCCDCHSRKMESAWYSEEPRYMSVEWQDAGCSFQNAGTFALPWPWLSVFLCQIVLSSLPSWESPAQASKLCLRYSRLHSLSHVPKEEFRSPSLLGLNQQDIDFWWLQSLCLLGCPLSS